MNASKIKKTLITYLQTRYSNIRIYQEKSIGSSICDVMTVTDILTGYEIKSDLDNFKRLDEQINSYNMFFDQNYLVVGSKYIDHAVNKIPSFWGIIYVNHDEISVIRKAKMNSQVSRRRQLSILWKTELKNILIKNNMPPYIQKEKGYIADRIAEYVDANTLGIQISEELMLRDCSIYNDYTNDKTFKNIDDFPVYEIMDMLSEKDLSNFTLDLWMEMYKKSASIRAKKEIEYTKPIPDRTPNRIPYTDIEISLGAPWISVSIVNEFISYILNKKYQQYANYEPITGNWFIRNKDALGRNNTNAEVVYGIKRYNALHILETSLNTREIKLYDKGSVYNERDTLAAIEKQKLINCEFRNWVLQDTDRCILIENIYNKIFSKYTVCKYDGSKLTFPKLSEKYNLYPYQKDAVQRIISSKNTLLALDVGMGKTNVMIASAMKMREDGISRKNMFVVPNDIVGQWEKTFYDLYPHAKVIAIEPQNFKPDIRQKILKQIRDGDYDGIIIAYSCFHQIPLSVEKILENMHMQLRKIESVIQSTKTSVSQQKTREYVMLSKEKREIISTTEDFINSIKTEDPDDITFNSLQVNTLFVDEAHNYKNIPIKTKIKNIKGINTKGSHKCQDLMQKVRYIQQDSSGKGVVFATGTPLCNSIADVYAMQMYLQYDDLEETRLNVFDNWVKTFAVLEQLCEIDVNSSKYRFIHRFSRFVNLPELALMFSQIAVFHANQNSTDLPDFSGYTDVVIDQNKKLAEYMKKICERTDAIRSGIINPKYDNMLKVSIDGRKAALDLSLVGEHQPFDKTSKIFRCVENVAKIYNSNSDATQIIFCDYSTPKTDNFSVYDQIKMRLIGTRIPGNEIAFIHSYRTESRKTELFRKFNAGEIRILIGSTFKLGIGTNVQVKLKAIHHLDVPWRPADMIQREGRILRQGNTNNTVQIFRYIMRGSFDSYSWQILETKQRFISQFLSGSAYQRTIADLENNVLSYSEVKALALSEPLMKQLAEKENEILNLNIIISKERESREDAKKEVEYLETQLPILQKQYERSVYHMNRLHKKSNEQYIFEYHNLKDFFAANILTIGTNKDLKTKIFGFTLRFDFSSSKNSFVAYLEQDDDKYLIELSDTSEGNAKRVINALKRFSKYSSEKRQAYDNAVQRKNELSAFLESDDSKYQIKLTELKQEVEEIKILLKSKNLIQKRRDFDLNP